MGRGLGTGKHLRKVRLSPELECWTKPVTRTSFELSQSPYLSQYTERSEKKFRDRNGTFIWVWSNDLLLSGVPRHGDVWSVDVRLVPICLLGSSRLGPSPVVWDRTKGIGWVSLYSLWFTTNYIWRFKTLQNNMSSSIDGRWNGVASETKPVRTSY